MRASHMKIADAETFRNTCVQQETGNAILGCYVQNRVYVYDIKNEKLNGIREVTAAHEMLHAAWARLSDYERDRVSALLEQAYARVEDETLKERMEYYSRTEPGERHNELHSILATEYKNLGDELEQYFGRYFLNRQKIVSYYEQYHAVFEGLQRQADASYIELNDLSKQVDAVRASYEKNASVLQSDITVFNSKANNGGFNTVYQFNTARNALSVRISALDTQYKNLSSLISTYNSKLNTYQELALQQKELNKSIDATSIVPAPSL